MTDTEKTVRKLPPIKSTHEMIAGLPAPDLTTYLTATIRALGAFNLPAEHELVLRLERDGGGCPRCGKPWELVEFTALWAGRSTHYFTPACECFPRCPECGTSWHREIAAGNEHIEACSSCAWRAHPVYGRICRACEQAFRTSDPGHKVCGLCVGKQGRPVDRGLDRLFGSEGSS